MGIINKVQKKIKRKNPTDPRLLICVECGSDQVSINAKSIKCRSCGAKRSKKKLNKSGSFNIGDIVRIVEEGKGSNQVYLIRKIKKSQDGTTLYLLKSDASDISLLYHESINSYLERAE